MFTNELIFFSCCFTIICMNSISSSDGFCSKLTIDTLKSFKCGSWSSYSALSLTTLCAALFHTRKTYLPCSFLLDIQKTTKSNIIPTRREIVATSVNSSNPGWRHGAKSEESVHCTADCLPFSSTWLSYCVSLDHYAFFGYEAVQVRYQSATLQLLNGTVMNESSRDISSWPLLFMRLSEDTYDMETWQSKRETSATAA